ncbi:MAG: outer membrane lipoprotein-sorting protein, partial [Pseudomonadales bacterium]
MAPPRDAGNATLKSGERMWTFSPQINRVMRLPYSMMAQGWAGSDFSYNDLSRTDQLLRDYDLELVEVSVQGDFQVAVVELKVEVVVHLRIGLLPSDVGQYGPGRAEEHERLVDEVGSEVVQHSRPGLGELSPEAIGTGVGTVADR